MSGIEHVQKWLDSDGYNFWDFGGPEFIPLERNIQIYHGRWSISTLDVWADEEGHVFGILYEVPATEYQEGIESNPSMVPVKSVMSWTC
jgi:hypothetical protein